jgi:quaternary ammonium compound-resistance protein SugE
MGVAIFGIFAFGESHAPARLLSLALVVAGIVGLKMSA